MNGKPTLTGLAAAALLAGVSTISLAQTTPPTATPPAPVAQNDLLNATLWMSNSVESRANSLAIYALARIRLDQALADKAWSALDQKDAADKPLAIILDLDETVLDNNLYETWLIKQKTDFASATYDAWTKDTAATAIPGSIDFLQYADSKGVKLFYVTNREATQEDSTRQNMQKLGAPMGGNVDTFLMSREKPDWTSRKGTRRDFVAKDYRVIMLFGDNYGDFSDDAGKSEAERMASFETNKAHFTKDWFVIANPEYGSFESAPFNHNFSIPADTRRQMKIDALPSWKGPAPK